MVQVMEEQMSGPCTAEVMAALQIFLPLIMR
jgi:hypothetical protein